MKLKLISVVLVGLLASGITTQAQAGYQYVGSWELSSGPNWGTQPRAYTGQQAAALLFGGSASDYAISSIGANINQIDNMAWYGVLGYSGNHNGGVLFAEDYVSANSTQAAGYYFSGNSSYTYDGYDAASAYVDDNAGLGNMNYAFRITQNVPEPGSLLLLGLGLAGLAASRRRTA